MPDWAEILAELGSATLPNGVPDFDGVRRKYLLKLANHTGRPTILYVSRFTQCPLDHPAEAVLASIRDEDLQGLMTVVHGLGNESIDLILHSPGGSPAAAEALITYLRGQFRGLRVIVPSLAMSAATMMACAADEIVMGRHSFLGPIDPQLVTSTPRGQIVAPAQAILDEFDEAARDCQSDPSRLAVWMPILGQYRPGLRIQCRNAIELARSLVRTWLREYMFADDVDRRSAAARARRVADWLGSHSAHKQHDRHLPRHALIGRGMHIVPLEDDPVLQDLVLSVFHAATHVFSNTGAVKIIENHLGRAFIQHIRVRPAPEPGGPKQPQRGAGALPT